MNLSPEEINGIVSAVTEAARQIFPEQTAEVENWITKQVQAKIQERISQGVVSVTNNPLFLIVIGILIYKYSAKN